MNQTRQGLHGIIIVSLSAIVAIGSIITALAETNQIAPSQISSPTAIQQQTLQNTNQPQVASTLPANTSSPTSPPPASPTATVTQMPSPQSQTCNPPEGWTFYTVQPSETLESISQKFGITTLQIMEGNCLSSSLLPPGIILYLPPSQTTPNTTLSATECTPPDSWVKYTVKAEDNLFRIGLNYNITTDDLQLANCLTDSTIRAGQILYVPSGKPKTPTP